MNDENNYKFHMRKIKYFSFVENVNVLICGPNRFHKNLLEVCLDQIKTNLPTNHVPFGLLMPIYLNVLLINYNQEFVLQSLFILPCVQY